MSEATTGAPPRLPSMVSVEPRLPVPEPPECGNCGTPMSSDPTAFDRVHEAIERAGIAVTERTRSGP